MKNIPKKIYIQVGEDNDSDDFDKIKLDCGVTWCWERINENDIVFYRSKDKESK